MTSLLALSCKDEKLGIGKQSMRKAPTILIVMQSNISCVLEARRLAGASGAG